MDTDDPVVAAERLEAALERIARAAVRSVEPTLAPVIEQPAMPTDEIAARLDALIHRLRTALGEAPG